MFTYSGVEQSTTDARKDGDIDGERETKGHGDVEQLGEVDVAWVDIVAGVRGVRVGNLRSRQRHDEEEERAYELARDLNGMEPKLLNEGMRCHCDLTLGCMFNGWRIEMMVGKVEVARIV